MTKTKFISVVIWMISLLFAGIEGRTLPDYPPFQHLDFPPVLILGMFGFAFFTSLIISFIDRKKSLDVAFLRRLVDRKYGDGAFQAFIAELMPRVLMMALMSVFGFFGLLSTHFSTQDLSAYVVSGFFLSAGTGMGCAWLLSLKYPPRLI